MAKAVRTVQITSAGVTMPAHTRTDGGSGGAAETQGVVLMQDGSDTPFPLPTALGANGGFKIEGVAGGTAVSVSGTFTQATPIEVGATPTISTSAYASGDTVGGVMTFTGAGNAGTIMTAIIDDKDAESAALELWLFNATITPAADNAAHSISDADMAKCIGVIDGFVYHASALNSVGQAVSVGLAYKLPSGSDVYGLLVTRGAPTFSSTSDLKVRIVVLP